MNFNRLKPFLPAIVFIVLLLPIVTSSVLDFEQRIETERIAKEERLKKDAEERVYLTGKFDQTKRDDFVLVPEVYGIAGYPMYLRKETLAAFLQMKTAAEKDGVSLYIASATRNFDYQKELWNKKWTGTTLVENQDLSISIPDGLERFKKILEYSAAPGASRHHWGTDIDLNAATPEYFETDKGQKIYDWLTANAPTFGFCQTYTLKGSARPTGYNEEKWHWSYLPLSREFTKEYIRLIKNSDISGFLGDEYAPQLNLIHDYVSSINPECL